MSPRPRVIVSFADASTEDLFNREDTKAARRICFRWTSRGPTEVEVVDYH